MDGVHGRFGVQEEADVEVVGKLLSPLCAAAREDERKSTFAEQEGETVVAACLAQAKAEMAREKAAVAATSGTGRSRWLSCMAFSEDGLARMPAWRRTRTNPLGAMAPDGSSRVRMRGRMEQNSTPDLARRGRAYLSDPAFFDAAIVAQAARQ